MTSKQSCSSQQGTGKGKLPVHASRLDLAIKDLNIKQRISIGAQHTVALGLLASCSLYFLVENGSANSFTTYLISLGWIGILIFQRASLSFYDRPLLALTATLLIYLACSVAWSGTDESLAKHLGYGILIITFCLSIGYCIERYRWYLYWFVLLIILAAAINSGYSLYLHHTMPEYQPLPEPRLFALGRLSNPVISALSYGFAALLCAYFVMTRERMISKFVFGEFVVLFLGAIVLSGSRGVWPALLAGTIAGILVHYEGHRKQQFIGITIAGLAVIASGLALGLEAVFARALSFRPEIWTEFISRTYETNLILGAGMTADSRFDHPELMIKHPHSIYVATFYYGGVIGFTLLAATLSLAARRILQMESGDQKTLTTMLFTFGLVATLVDGDELLTKINYLWLLIWLPVGLAMYRPHQAQPVPAASDL